MTIDRKAGSLAKTAGCMPNVARDCVHGKGIRSLLTVGRELGRHRFAKYENISIPADPSTMFPVKRLSWLAIILLAAGPRDRLQQDSRRHLSRRQPAPQLPVASMPKIDQQKILEHIKVLSSDEYEGRAPGTKGEELSVKYIQDQFKQLNLKPGNPDGTYVQKVPLVGITGTEARPLTTRQGRRRKQTFKWRTMWSRGPSTSPTARRSRTPMSSSPATASRRPSSTGTTSRTSTSRARRSSCSSTIRAVPDPADPSKLDPKTFNGDAMTYYGRWTYKFEEGARKGAAGDLRRPRDRTGRLSVLRRAGQSPAKNSIS